jgi:hypothetical protein
MSPEQLIAAALAGRAEWFPLEEGKRVRVRRPSEVGSRALVKRDVAGKFLGIEAGLLEVKACVVDWDGFTETDFTPAGSSDPVPFHTELWGVWIEDRAEALNAVATKILDMVLDHEGKKAETAKN